MNFLNIKVGKSWRIFGQFVRFHGEFLFFGTGNPAANQFILPLAVCPPKRVMAAGFTVICENSRLYLILHSEIFQFDL